MKGKLTDRQFDLIRLLNIEPFCVHRSYMTKEKRKDCFEEFPVYGYCFYDEKNDVFYQFRVKDIIEAEII